MRAGKKMYFKEEKYIDHLFRLLTDPNMESVWSTITKLPPNVPHRLKTDPAFSLWVSITRALREFDLFISFEMTTKQKSHKLLSISSKTKFLIKKISADPFAKEIAKKIVNYYLSKMNIDWREREGEIPPFYDYDFPLTLRSDCEEAWREI